MKLSALLFFLIAFADPCWAEDNAILPRISLDEATRLVIKEGNKRVLRATTEFIEGKEIHVIKVLTPDGHIQHFKIDAETGAVISE